MLDELVKTVRLHLSERLTSPLFGAFAVSWCAWNYRMILVLLSGEPVLGKFALIDGTLYADPSEIYLRGLLYPLLTALAYLFVYPYPAKWVYAFARKRQKEILETRRKIEDETPLTIEDSRKIRQQMASAEQVHHEGLERKEREIERLKNRILDLEQSLITAQNTTSAPTIRGTEKNGNLAPELIEYLHILKSSGGMRSVNSILRHPVHTKVEAEYYLGELEHLGLVTKGWSDDLGTKAYSLTQQGRSAVMELIKTGQIAEDDDQ